MCVETAVCVQAEGRRPAVTLSGSRGRCWNILPWLFSKDEDKRAPPFPPSSHLSALRAIRASPTATTALPLRNKDVVPAGA